MGINYVLYLSEIIVLAIVWIIGVIIFEVKHKEGLLKFFGIVSFIFIVLFSLTFILERPQMDIKVIDDIEVKSKEKIARPRTIYHFQNVTDKVRINGNIDYQKTGEYTVQFEIDTLIGKYIKSVKVNVVDTKAPEITLEGEEKYNQPYTKDYEEPGFSAIDDYEGDLTDKVVCSKEEIDENRFNIKYEVKDSSGNKAQKVREVTIIDNVPPTITLKGSSNMTITLNGKYTESGATAKDERDGDLTNKITIEGEVNTSKEGTYKIIYKVSDLSGNEATKTRIVIVASKVNTEGINIKVQDGTNGPKGVIYLTFDDGPSTATTPKILDILKEKNVKATFFILNYNAAGEKIVKRAYAEGHTIGIHGYSHQYSEIYKSVDIYMENITKLQAKIKASTGYNATITRFPGGSSNKVSKYNPGIMTKLCKEVVDRGYKYFDWNISSGDAGGAKTADDVYNNVVKGLSKSKQNVVLMHDIKTITMNALSRIIDYGLANGYTFEKITEDTPMVTHKPNN